MNRRLAVLMGIALLAVGLGVGLKRAGREGPPREQTSSGVAREPGGSKSRRASVAFPRDEAFRKLKALAGSGPEKVVHFEEIEALARRLSDAQLEELIGEQGELVTTTLALWVRCAAYAELGRRDPVNTLMTVLGFRP